MKGIEQQEKRGTEEQWLARLARRREYDRRRYTAMIMTIEQRQRRHSAYDNDQSSDIFWPIKAFNRSNQIWSVKSSIHYQWGSH